MSQTLPTEWEQSFMTKQTEMLDLIRSMWTNAYDVGFAAGQAAGSTGNPDLIYTQADLDNAVQIAEGAVKADLATFLQNEIADEASDKARLEQKLAELQSQQDSIQ